ncbi:hypothetical protein SAMN04488550_0594 [Gordonia malaquae]|uniref:Uncharacterized protein n=1 Tax=Gordonia malaquae NBRC 108250 TaxID=1223542 RepID=M3VGE4_GORML|nr:hypothetical protein [Gordonia malaquae]GAC80844.1 hypothetical protein GM1_023_00030 [Gordonia malaquae NBRC 108250]SEB67314.1 hypothetical protein SAMN04488550_0594 [Gordonia malaquae]
MSVQRWERARAAWLTGHSDGHGPLSATMRRRSEILERSARRSERSGAGITATAVQDEISPGLWHRLTHDGDGSRHHRPRWTAVAVVVAIFLGPGLLAGHGFYKVLWRRSPSIGRLWAWPWVGTAVLAALVLAVRGVGFRPVPNLDRRFPLSLVETGPLWALVAWQLAVACLTVAALIALWGWRGVPAKAVGAPIKNSDGSFREVREDEKVDLDPWKDHGLPQPDETETPEPESAYEKWEAEQQRKADLDAIYGAVATEPPVDEAEPDESGAAAEDEDER